jgi:acyl-CoA reductase-like NAD-dependent aldehyde dehydrogenase
MSTERIIVQHAVADKFCDALKRATRMVFAESAPAPILIGTGLVAKNRGLVRDAVSKGAGILIGDANTEELSNTRMRPIVIDRVTKEMDVYQIESFGPSVSLFVVDTDAEAIMLANDTEYGLTAAVYTENLKRGLRIARQIESG